MCARTAPVTGFTRAPQLQQLMVEGGQSRGVDVLSLLRLALLGILCAYAYLWLKARLK